MDTKPAKEAGYVINVLWFIHQVSISLPSFPNDWIVLMDGSPFDNMRGVITLGQ